ncbi:hypothetical protein [Vibrio diabolicus]|uniref:hypothetical protein n=1 Tax=Vibrio diabolicus TaxID=50719 RepID=UPI0021608EC2|nr:hypothetical protein [Vibrio diabolicus]MCS0376636.1 hypothetical protein [Vibrio diabolicus]
MNAKPTSLRSNMMMRVRLSLYAPNPQTNARTMTDICHRPPLFKQLNAARAMKSIKFEVFNGGSVCKQDNIRAIKELEDLI